MVFNRGSAASTSTGFSIEFPPVKVQPLKEAKTLPQPTSHACFASIARTSTGKEASVGSAAPAAPPAASNEKPAHDVVAGAMARAASQSTIHPLDTMKVRMQAGKSAKGLSSTAGSARNIRVHASGVQVNGLGGLQRALGEFASLYKGVLGAATGAGVIIGAYFAFYSTSKKYIKEHHPTVSDGTAAFASGAVAAVGSSFVKVPIAVCIRSVQAGVYQNALHAAKSIVAAAGVRGLFTGFLPTLLEDVPDMAVKFAVYESLRAVHCQLNNHRQPSTWEDLLLGGSAGAAAAAATTPLDVVKTRMMCSASQRPTIANAVKSLLAEGHGWRTFFKGVGPRALSNGLNSAIFFCFFEAFRRVLISRQQERLLQQSVELQLQHQQQRDQLHAPAAVPAARLALPPVHSGHASSKPASRIACLSLAIPLNHQQGWS